MQILTENDLAGSLDKGFQLVPLQPSAGSPQPLLALPICLVVRETPDPAAGHFVLIREDSQARVLLGCATDSAGQPQEWLEIWLQQTRLPAGAGSAFGARLNNAAWDARWRDLAAALRQSEPGAAIANPLELGHLPPAILDVRAGRFTALAASAGGPPLALCVDDRLLTAAGLPGYAGSACRYLFAPAQGEHPARFVRLRPEAPSNDQTVDLQDLLPGAGNAVTLGLEGGSLIVRRFSPLTLEDFSDVASGRAWKGLDNARRIFHVPGVYRLLEDEDAMRCGSAHLFTTAQGRTGRLGEALYLKLQVIRQAFQLVRDHVAQSQLPFLNLAADSFRVRLGATGLGLPFLWTAKTSLVRPGQAYALPLQNASVRYFQGLQPLTASIYRPGAVGMATRGTANNVRIRKVFPPTAEGIALEGTIRSAERLSNDENDLLFIHLPLSAGDADLLGHLDFTDARSEGEAVFRTIPQKFPEAVSAALPGIEGSNFSQIAFDIVSPLSTPLDLYSLGIIALRVLLAHEDNPLPEVFDRAFSLAHEVEQSVSGDVLEDRIAQAFAADDRWRAVLGWQHALYAGAGGAPGDAVLPARLWWATLATVLRLFPKLLGESFCKGYGDAPALALETVFDAPIRELDKLLLRWRAFLLGDWSQNLEVGRVIDTIRGEY